MGYSYIAAAHAEDIDRFYQRHFNPYLNFHRPCGQPERITDARGKEKYVYRRYATPWETLRYLSRATPDALGHLRPELSIQGLERIANSTATPRQPGECKKPSGNSSSASGTSVRAHEKRRAPWKCRAVENEENQTQVSLVSPCLWKSLRDSHIPTAPATAVFLTGISIRKTQERSPAQREPELHPFRLILGLEMLTAGRYNRG